MLFAPYVGRPLGHLFAEHGLNYVDEQGNCHLQVEGLAAHVEGRQPRRGPGSDTVRAEGVAALFALLAEPAFLGATARDIGRAAGTTHATALAAVRRLERSGAVAIVGRERRWLPGGLRLGLDRWLAEYALVLRSRLLIGRYRTPDATPLDLDRRVVEGRSTASTMYFGGAAAAYRIVPHHRGGSTVLHVGDVADAVATLHAVPDREGPLTLMRLPGPLATRGIADQTVHPLLVYAEMLQSADERLLEASQLFREHALARYR
jgi:hypothetical protein